MPLFHSLIPDHHPCSLLFWKSKKRWTGGLPTHVFPPPNVLNANWKKTFHSYGKWNNLVVIRKENKALKKVEVFTGASGEIYMICLWRKYDPQNITYIYSYIKLLLFLTVKHRNEQFVECECVTPYEVRLQVIGQ